MMKGGKVFSDMALASEWVKEAVVTDVREEWSWQSGSRGETYGFLLERCDSDRVRRRFCILSTHLILIKNSPLQRRQWRWGEVRPLAQGHGARDGVRTWFWAYAFRSNVCIPGSPTSSAQRSVGLRRGW
jgi:hypothetical protein